MAPEGGEEKPRNMVSLSSSAGYCYSDFTVSSSNNPNTHSSHLIMNHFQNLESNPEIYNLTTNMEMIGFPPKNLNQQTEPNSAAMSKATICKSDGSRRTTSSKMMITAPDSEFYHGDQFNRSDIRQEDNMRFAPSSCRSDGFFVKSINIDQEQQQIMNMEDGFVGKPANPDGHVQFQIRSSKYRGPSQELLIELCNLGILMQKDPKPSKIKAHHTSDQWQDVNASSSSKKQSLSTLQLLELQQRKTKLLSMLEEVDIRYRRYSDQMKAVVSSFEAVAGDGAATVYSALASEAMSRHFRCLRDGIVGQIKATKKAMGEKDTVAAAGKTALSRGETPRLRVLDQSLRQQRAFQQMNMVESHHHPWRPQRGLPERSVSVLRAWLFDHFLHPYPSDVDKHILARQSGLSRSQVSNWFINARVRLWKPMVEDMYLEETKEQDINMASSNDTGRPNQNSHRPHSEDQEPTTNHLVRMIDSDSLSFIINHPEKHYSKIPQNQQPHDFRQHQQLPPQHGGFGRVADAFGSAELDFSSYHRRAPAVVSYSNENTHQNFDSDGGGNGGSGGVSLTLGLPQHGGGGVTLAFSAASQNSVFYDRDNMEDCQTVEYSLLDGEGQNLPYRNLMGAQLLHDLAG